MSTVVLTEGELDLAAAMLVGGAVLAIPTDTVYGLAATIANDVAVARLAVLKRRPSSVPIAVLCADAHEAIGCATAWPPAAATLAARYWPGPLTIVVSVARELSAMLGSEGTAGLRVPDDDVCRALLARTGPLAVTSANLHGAAPATTAASVLDVFADGIDAVLDAGRRDGAVSTVVDVSGTSAAVVRDGPLARDDVLGVLRTA